MGGLLHLKNPSRFFSPVQLAHRCGFDEHGIMVPYVKFLEKFSDRDDGGLASSILADSTHRCVEGLWVAIVVYR